MQEPATAPWGLSISDTDSEKLKVGFEPQDQGDKWCVLAMNQSENVASPSIMLEVGWVRKYI
ncbi:hypothetical protein F5Y05DRAFT_381409 [Hypoxylon sp. FL0543]|nr:hypothetical protein F5Y05DRAFT_381409 [Hypoxylon sp. FL0543]